MSIMKLLANVLKCNGCFNRSAKTNLKAMESIVFGIVRNLTGVYR